MTIEEFIKYKKNMKKELEGSEEAIEDLKKQL